MLESLKTMWVEKKPLIIMIGVIIVLLIVGLILAVVSNLAPKSKKIATIDPNVTLNWWKLDYNGNSYENIIKQFKEIPGNKNVNIQITNKTLDSGYYRDLISDLARKIGPDIVTLQNNDLPAYKEFLSPINNIKGAKLTDYRDNFVNLAVRETMDKDKVYCVTSYVDNLQLYYNSDLLTQSQYSRPADSWDTLTKQIQNLRQIPVRGESFKQSPIAMGTGGRSNNPGGANIEVHADLIPAIIFQYEGQIYDYQTQKPVLGKKQVQSGDTSNQDETDSDILEQDSNSYKAIEFYNSFANSNDSRYSWNKNNPKATDMFAQGRLVYNIQYKSFADEIKRKNPRINFDVTPIPQRSSSYKRTFGKFNMDCLNSSLALKAQNTSDLDSVYKYEKAQDFMEFLTTKENQIDLAFKTGLPSAHKDGIAEQLKGDKATRTFADGALYSDNYYMPDVERTQNLWSQLFEKVQYSNTSLEQATQEAITEYNLIAGGRPQLRR